LPRNNQCFTSKYVPFGSEYAYRPFWHFLNKCYIRAFGVVDLPSRLRASVVVKELAKLRGRSFLDFGCGTGCYSFYLSRNPANDVCGLDVNESRIEDCKVIARCLARKNLRFTVSSTENGLCGFHNAAFDAVLAVEVLTCVPDIRATLAEFHRILRPDGCVIGHVPVLTQLREWETTMFNDENLTQLLSESGFQRVSISRTFGWDTNHLCRVFGWVARSRMLSAILFPFLLIASSMCSVKSLDGEYRFFVAHKGVGATTGSSQPAA
jgi:SAM-dependent methyltransferase